MGCLLACGCFLFDLFFNYFCLCVDGHQDDFCSHCVSVDEVERVATEVSSKQEAGSRKSFAELVNMAVRRMYHASQEHDSQSLRTSKLRVRCCSAVSDAPYGASKASPL